MLVAEAKYCALPLLTKQPIMLVTRHLGRVRRPCAGLVVRLNARRTARTLPQTRTRNVISETVRCFEPI
ncbi:MAG: hypothetical protein Q4A71_05345 [Actinomycetaceae bacterium]|nr:hypothetical protein [Actinomycetaceae bacterium]